VDPSLSAIRTSAISAPTGTTMEIASARLAGEKSTPAVGDAGKRTYRPKVRPQQRTGNSTPRSSDHDETPGSSAGRTIRPGSIRGSCESNGNDSYQHARSPNIAMSRGTRGSAIGPPTGGSQQ
jgi:hypothetical protein